MEFAKVLQNFFVKPKKSTIHQSTFIGKNSKIDKSVSIGANCVIGKNVKIGRNTIINHNVIVHDNSIIGDNCYIKSGAIIGEDGFGFSFDEDIPIRLPHIGIINIGENVEIGSNTVIARGTLDDTVIEKNVKIDDQVFIAHNCYIGKNTIICACAEISGSVTMGNNCWIGPNASIIQNVFIGSNATVGIGTVITKNVNNQEKVMSLEGLSLRKLINVKKLVKYGK